MTRLEDVRQKVASLYEQKLESRDQWADWLYAEHVLVVAQNARTIAEQVGANIELSEIAALLHDVADYKMARDMPNHEAESLKTARVLLESTGYSEVEIAIVVDDAIRFHSCHDGERPKSKEGLVLATADSLAHLQTDFYLYAVWAMGAEGEPLRKIKAWTLAKIERDLNNKISFDNIRELARPDYEMIKRLFER